MGAKMEQHEREPRYNKVFLTTSFLNSLTRSQFTALHQTTRLVGKIGYHLHALRAVLQTGEKAEKLINTLEAGGMLASVLHEAVQRFFIPRKGQTEATFDVLKTMRVNTYNLGILEEFKSRRLNLFHGMGDKNFVLYDELRNNFGFHYFDDYFDGYITDDDAANAHLFAVQPATETGATVFPFTYDVFSHKFLKLRAGTEDVLQPLYKFMRDVQDEAVKFRNALEGAASNAVEEGAVFLKSLKMSQGFPD